MFAEELTSRVVIEILREGPFQISEQQPKGQVVAQLGSCEATEIRPQADDSVSRNCQDPKSRCIFHANPGGFCVVNDKTIARFDLIFVLALCRVCSTLLPQLDNDGIVTVAQVTPVANKVRRSSSNIGDRHRPARRASSTPRNGMDPSCAISAPMTCRNISSQNAGKRSRSGSASVLKNIRSELLSLMAFSRGVSTSVQPLEEHMLFAPDHRYFPRHVPAPATRAPATRQDALSA